MKIKLIERRKPGTKTGPGKFYASPVNVGKKTLRDIAHDIAGRSSLTRGDIENVLANFMDCLPHYLRDGFSVQLGEFGTMRLTLSSEGAATEKAFKTETIKRKHPKFAVLPLHKKTLYDWLHIRVLCYL